MTEDLIERLDKLFEQTGYKHCKEAATALREQEKEVTELQRLCERAYLILSDTWEEHTDEEGYGPVSLLRDLEKAKNGQALKDNYLWIEVLLTRIEGLEAEVEQLRLLVYSPEEDCHE